MPYREKREKGFPPDHYGIIRFNSKYGFYSKAPAGSFSQGLLYYGCTGLEKWGMDVKKQAAAAA